LHETLKSQAINLKKRITAFQTFVFIGISRLLSGQTGEPWTSKELLEPDALAIMLGNAKAQKPVIFNIGPPGNIKGAIAIGSTPNKANLEKFSKALVNIPKDKMVVIYCGCCPFRNCPNIRPAFNLLKERGYKNPRLLNLKQNLKVDLTDYGYPMD
jgi:thiosulfate/3-mercaptopyruvate sulfurtransferase